MSVPPGSARHTGNTARLADQGTSTRLDPAHVRRTVDAITKLTGCRRQEARERINAWTAGGRALDDLDAYLRATFRIDPTGVTAVRNVDKGIAQPDPMCCLAMPVEDRLRAAALGVFCSVDRCARRDLVAAQPDLRVIGGGRQ